MAGHGPSLPGGAVAARRRQAAETGQKKKARAHQGLVVGKDRNLDL